MKISVLLLTALFTVTTLQAQDATKPAGKDAAYIKTVTARAAKIVAGLGISPAEKAEKVTGIIAGEYQALNAVYTSRDEKIKTAKESGAGNKESLDASIKAIKEATAAATASLHATFLKTLAIELTAEQVTGVKDGMTYGVLPITYKGYLAMLPDLTPAQKEQIMTWLVEAREYAMDAESSEKKHWWFGKYKGRINNYLSASGYDLKKESEAWHRRMADKKESKSR
jgi:hypothetical protein